MCPITRTAHPHAQPTATQGRLPKSGQVRIDTVRLLSQTEGVRRLTINDHESCRLPDNTRQRDPVAAEILSRAAAARPLKPSSM